MFKRGLTAFMGTRHQRGRKGPPPILDSVHEHEARLANASEETLRNQTAKFRGLLHERTHDLETRIAELKEAKRTASEASERERIDTELGGVDGSGGLEADLRRTIAETLDEILPEAFATVREASRRLMGTTRTLTGR